MKKQLLTLAFAALTFTAFGERPTLDESAIRLGVRDWYLVRTARTESLDVNRLKALYRADVEFTDPTNDQPVVAHGLQAYNALWQPLVASVQNLDLKFDGKVEVAVQGSKATTAFVFRPSGTQKDGQPLNCITRVNLTWERHDGLWQIVREQLSPEKPVTPAATVADAK